MPEFKETGWETTAVPAPLTAPLGVPMGPLLAELCTGAAPESLPLPVTALSPIPLHFLRRPALEGAAFWFRLLDAAGA